MGRPKRQANPNALQPRFVRCDWHPEHGADDLPTGPRCGAPATHRIVWLDGSNRYSHGCGAHLAIDSAAPPHRIEKMADRRAIQTRTQPRRKRGVKGR